MNNLALITGASSGLGSEIARIHAALDRDCILVGRNKNKLVELKNELVAKYAINVEVRVCDLAIKADYEQIIAELLNDGLIPKYLINNAAFGFFGNFYDIDINQADNLLNTNIKAVSYFCHRIVPYMLKQTNDCFILNIASAAAFVPGAYQALYYASKAFILSFSEAIALELEDSNIKVSTYCPGAIATNFHKNANIEKPLKHHKNKLNVKEAAKEAYDLMQKGGIKVSPTKMNIKLNLGRRLLPYRKLARIVKKSQNNS